MLQGEIQCLASYTLSIVIAHASKGKVTPTFVCCVLKANNLKPFDLAYNPHPSHIWREHETSILQWIYKPYFNYLKLKED